MALLICLAGTSSLGWGSGRDAHAQSPPPPPTFIPTPIGKPPGPPTPIPSPMPITSPTATATATPTTSSAATPTATKVPVVADFSLDAVRVSKVNNPGNLQGLAAVRPGSTVWLMMYYTVRSLAHSTKRVTTYVIQYAGKTIFRVTYDSTSKPTEVGRYSRFSVYVIPRSLPYGHYVFKAVLKYGAVSQSKSWKFNLARQDRLATTTGSF